MALSKYDKTKRHKQYTQLPKGAYVVKIMGAKEVDKIDEDGKRKHYISFIFDIAEGEYAGYYKKIFDANTDPDRKWPNDGTFNLNIPDEGTPEFFATNYGSFFGDLEDSNDGYVFNGEPDKKGYFPQLVGKLIGGKFCIEQTEYNGRIYDHTKLRWTCVAEDVRMGKAGNMPNDKLIGSKHITARSAQADPDGFMEIPNNAAEEIPF